MILTITLQIAYFKDGLTIMNILSIANQQSLIGHSHLEMTFCNMSILSLCQKGKQ